MARVNDGTIWALGAVAVLAGMSALAGGIPLFGSRSKLTKQERAALPASDFVFPRRRAYPIPNLEHGRLALTMATWTDKGIRDLPKIKKVVFARYPSLISWWNDRPWVATRPQQRVTWRKAA